MMDFIDWLIDDFVDRSFLHAMLAFVLVMCAVMLFVTIALVIIAVTNGWVLPIFMVGGLLYIITEYKKSQRDA